MAKAKHPNLPSEGGSYVIEKEGDTPRLVERTQPAGATAVPDDTDAPVPARSKPSKSAKKE